MKARLHHLLILVFGFGAAAAFLAGSLPAQAAEVKKFDLKTARDYAVEHSYDAKKSHLDLETARQKLKETVASGLPQISANVNYNNNLKLATSLIPNFFEGKFEEKIPVQFGTQHNATANIQVQQLIFNGSYFVGLQTSKLYRSLAEQGVERTSLNVQEAVTTSYYLILVAEENERILQSTLANLEKTYAEILEMNKEGFVAETDADLIQIALTQLKNGLQTVQKQKDMAAKLMKFQMGLDLDEPIALTDTLEDILRQTDVGRSIQAEFKIENNIDYQLLSGQEKLTEMALKNEKSRYLPSVSAFFTYQQNAFRDKFNFFSSGNRWFPMQVLGVNVSIPLFKSGSQSAKVAQASLALDQARNAREQVSQALLLEAEQTKIRLSSAQENYVNMKANLKLSQKVYEATLAKYKEGVASSMELTQANDKYLQSQSDYFQALSELLNAKNKMDRLTNNY